MARQNPQAVEALVRPVIPRSQFAKTPIVKTATYDTATNGFNSLSVQPPAGVTWQLDYANEVLTGGTTSLGYAQIDYFDGTNWVTVAYKKAGDWITGAQLSVASFGQGPILLTNTNYLRIGFTVASSQQAVVSIVALVEPI